MQLDTARRLAEALAASIRPYVRRGLIAGSIRRRKPEVKDIELVLIAKWEAVVIDDLFRDQVAPVNILYREWAQEIALHGTDGCPRVEWIKPGTNEIIPWTVQPGGRYWRGWLPDHAVKLDIFFARPETWGSVAMLRTGAADFGAAVLGRAKRVGYHFDQGALRHGNRLIPVPEERDVFRILGLEWVEPADRTGAEAARPGRDPP